MKILYSILVMLAVMSCGKSYDEQKRLSRAERARLLKEDSLALKIAVLPTIDCLPLYVAKEHLMYDTAQVDLRLRCFTAQMDQDTALAGRSVEGVVSDIVRMEHMRREGTCVEYLTRTNAYWQLITNYKARVKNPGQLGDKMVAMTRNSATDYLTDRVLDGVKTSSIVFRIQVNDVNVRLAMLLNNEMDAMWLTEPQATTARIYGNKVIADSRDLNARLGVIAFRAEVMRNERRKKQVEAFVKAYNMACDSLNERGIKAYAEVARKYYKMDPKTLGSLPKLKFYHVEKPSQKEIDIINKK